MLGNGQCEFKFSGVEEYATTVNDISVDMDNSFNRIKSGTEFNEWSGGAKCNFSKAMKTLEEVGTLLSASVSTVSKNARNVAIKYLITEQGISSNNAKFD